MMLNWSEVVAGLVTILFYFGIVSGFIILLALACISVVFYQDHVHHRVLVIVSALVDKVRGLPIRLSVHPLISLVVWVLNLLTRALAFMVEKFPDIAGMIGGLLLIVIGLGIMSHIVLLVIVGPSSVLINSGVKPSMVYGYILGGAIFGMLAAPVVAWVARRSRVRWLATIGYSILPIPFGAWMGPMIIWFITGITSD